MKKIKNVPVTVETKSEIVEEEGGLITLLGKRVLFHSMNYNYCGVLTGVNTSDLELSEAQVVFETGDYKSKSVKHGEVLPTKLFLRLSAIEAYWEQP
jgi:hypothetical protein